MHVIDTTAHPNYMYDVTYYSKNCTMSIERHRVTFRSCDAMQYIIIQTEAKKSVSIVLCKVLGQMSPL